MKTILAEKPSVARTIANVVGAQQRHDGYVSGNGFIVTWAIGHLVGLSMPQDYGFESWSLEHLPIIPENFKLSVTADPGIRKQFGTVSNLFSKATEIIVATDAGREGELIYRFIHSLSRPPGHIPIKRMWISDLTVSTIRKGLSNLRQISDYDHLYHAAKARSEADWLVGINFTQGYTLASGKSKALSIGRVQTATLRMVVERFEENTNFVPSAFFVPRLILEGKGNPIEFSCETKFNSKSMAIEVIEGLSGTQSPPISCEDRETLETPPLPFDLTTLQRTANKQFQYTAQQTLDTVQSLYEKHKLVTYPRTESEYLSSAQKEEVRAVFQRLDNLEINGVSTRELIQNCLYNIPESKVFNDSKVTDHHAIIPTGRKMDMDILTETEMRIFLLIAKRFFQSFMFDCKKSNRRLAFTLRDLVFSVKSSQISEPGWRLLEKNKELDGNLPETTEHETWTINDAQVHEGSTKPRTLFSESSLLGAMETAGKLLEDKSMREALKERGLGTPATRAGTIETLIKREYMVREKSKLIPTEIGKGLISSLKELSFTTPELTGDWEYRLKQIEKKELDYERFMAQIKGYVREVFPEVIKAAKKVSSIESPSERQLNQSFGKCPKCGIGEIRKGKKSYYCTQWNQDPKCDFTIWCTTFRKKLTDTQVRDLLEKGATRKIKGFISKSGKSFEAKLKLDPEHKVKLSFE